MGKDEITNHSGETKEVSVLVPLSGTVDQGEDGNGNEVFSEKLFVPPEPSENPYGSFKMVEEEVSVEKGRKKACACQNYTGIFLTLTSGFIFTCAGTIVKYMNGFHPVSLAVFRFQGVLLPSVALALYAQYVKKEEVFSTIWPLTDKEKLKRFTFTCIRGCLGGCALILLFHSIQTLSLADAILINSCRPVFVTFAAHVFLGEPCGVFPVFSALLTIVGVGIISRPPIITGEENLNTETLIGCGLAFIGMLAAAMSMVILRYVSRVHVSLVQFGFGFWGTLISVTGSFVIQRFDIPTTGPHIFLAFCLAAATFIAQYMLTIAMRYEQAGSVAIVRACDAVFAFLLQFFVLGIAPDIFSIIGALLITLCVLMIAFRKWVSTLPEKDCRRKRYWFVLK